MNLQNASQGITTLGSLLPDDSRLTLWEFGTGLDPPRDYRTLLPRTELDRAGRATLGQAVGSLQTRETGTGLYDTILAAYRAGQDGYRPDAPTHVVVFTDGRNEFDPGSISPDQLSAQLAASANPQRPVALTVISFGAPAEADALNTILKPVNGYVERLNRGDEVGATFIHLSAGGLHG